MQNLQYSTGFATYSVRYRTKSCVFQLAVVPRVVWKSMTKIQRGWFEQTWTNQNHSVADRACML